MCQMSIKCDNAQKVGVVESNVVRLPGDDKSTSFSASTSSILPTLPLRAKPRSACLNKLGVCSKLWRITCLEFSLYYSLVLITVV